MRVGECASRDSLALFGEKIELVEVQIAPKTTREHFRIDRAADTAVNLKTSQANSCGTKRELYRVKINNINNKKVLNTELRRIHETCEVHDFERLLQSKNALKKNKGQDERFELSGQVADVYQNHFLVHYDRLKDVIVRNEP